MGEVELWPPIEERGEFVFERREIVDWFVNPQGAKTSTTRTVTRKAQKRD
jgi:hypothetical protein